MRVEKVVILVSVIVVIVAFGVFLRLRSDVAVLPSQNAVTQPSLETQIIPSQPTATLSQISEMKPDFVPGHELAAQNTVVPTIEALPESLPPGTVASVNGVLISKTQLEEELNRLIISPTSHGGIKPEKKEELRKLALEELVTRELAFQEAKRMGLSISDKEIAASFKRIKSRYKKTVDFNQALKAENLTEEGLRERIVRDLLLKRINRVEIEDRSRVTDADAKTHYEKNKAKFVTPDSVRLWNIVADIKVGKEAEAKQKIDEAIKLLREGKDFYSVAHKYSDDDYRVLGGDHSWVHRGQLAAELEAVVFRAKVDEITGPFQIGSAWHIVKISSRRPETQLKFAEMKERIKKALYGQRNKQIRIDFINRLKATGIVKYYAAMTRGGE